MAKEKTRNENAASGAKGKNRGAPPGLAKKKQGAKSAKEFAPGQRKKAKTPMVSFTPGTTRTFTGTLYQ